jgi:hypothetical protein
MLKLNQDKTESIVFAPKHKVKSLTKLQFNFDGAILSESSCVRNLGVFFDQTLSMEQHASAITKSCFHHFRNIGRILHISFCELLAWQQCSEHAEVWIQLRHSHHTLINALP